jgi:hypothetical protein
LKEMMAEPTGLFVFFLSLYCLSHSTNPFFFSYFLNRVSLYAQAGLGLRAPIFASHIAEVTGTHHHAQLFY